MLSLVVTLFIVSNRLHMHATVVKKDYQNYTLEVFSAIKMTFSTSKQYLELTLKY